MPTVGHVDHKIIVGIALGITTSVAIASTIKLCLMRRRNKRENRYETQKLLNEYLLFHYGAADEILLYGDFGPKDSLDFHKKLAELCIKHFDNKRGIPSRALDLGCAVGRATFELSEGFDSVLGIDLSKTFVDAATCLAEQGHLAYSLTTIGELSQELVATVDESLDRKKVAFQRGDACNLPLDLGQFGCVLAANLLCRLRYPQTFFDRVVNLIAPGGILVLSSPYTFSTDYTRKENWIAGYVSQEGEEVSGLDGLKQTLGNHFELVEEKNLMFIIRETQRKHQWTISHVTVWRRSRDL